LKNFHLLGQGVDVAPLLNAVLRQPDLWNQNTLRTTHPQTPHKQVDDIWLRFNRLPEAGQEHQVIDDHESINYPAFARLPQARPLVFGLMARVDGERLGRVLITRMTPGGVLRQIPPRARQFAWVPVSLRGRGGSHAAG